MIGCDKHPNGKKADLSDDPVGYTSIGAGKKKGSVKIHQLYLLLKYFLLNTPKDSVSRIQIPFITYWKIFSRTCVYKFEEAFDNNMEYQMSAEIDWHCKRVYTEEHVLQF